MKKEKGIKKIGSLFKETFSEFIDDNVLKLCAALSYYTIFSLPPLAIIATSFCGIYYGKAAIQGDLHEKINGFVGNRAAMQIQEIIKSVNLSPHNAFAAIVGVIILVIVASGVFSEIQDSINYIWGIKTKHSHKLIRFVLNRLMAFSMIAAAGLVLLVSVVITSLMDLLNKNLLVFFPPETIYFYYVLSHVLLFLVITSLCIVIFKVLPDGKIAIRDCLLGASLTAFLFMMGKFVIGAYLRSSTMATVYGTTGSVILILAWVYYSAIILYFGAEFTKVYAKMYGKNIHPNTHTIRIAKPESNL
jgi:membrane protein